MVEETKDVTMEAEEPSKPEQSNETEEVAPSKPPLQAAGFRLERLLGGSVSKDTTMQYYTNPAKIIRRWLSTSSGAAANATAEDIRQAAALLLDPATSPGRALLVTDAEMNLTSETYLSKASAREFESWLIALAVRLLYKDQNLSPAFELANKGIEILLQHLEQLSMQMTSSVSTASLFPLLARLYRWRSLVAEAMKAPALSTALRIEMAKAYNMASLRRDVDSQATLLNCMLRDLLLASQVEQAQKLLANSTFPEAASNNQLCRYLYYSGRIQALRLEYTSSYSNLSQCLRKAPSNTALGFRIAAQRLVVVVQLLMGEIPERHVFFTSNMKTELEPYLKITQAVRLGDLAHYTQVVSKHTERFKIDATYTLISRLAHQVVKAGLRKLAVSYSRLSLEDVASRLGLPSARSAEFVVAKAIRDGVLDATINHTDGYVQSHDMVNVYATKEPSEAFHRRIAYCLTMHNDAVRGMRYPPDEYKKQLEASRGNRRKLSEDKTDEEKVQEFEDEFDDDY